MMRSTRSVLRWLRVGAGAGQPSDDVASPLLVLERRRLSDGEVDYLAARLVGSHLDRVGVGVEITKVIDALPHPGDVSRVERAAFALRECVS